MTRARGRKGENHPETARIESTLLQPDIRNAASCAPTLARSHDKCKARRNEHAMLLPDHAGHLLQHILACWSWMVARMSRPHPKLADTVLLREPFVRQANDCDVADDSTLVCPYAAKWKDFLFRNHLLPQHHPRKDFLRAVGSHHMWMVGDADRREVCRPEGGLVVRHTEH